MLLVTKVLNMSDSESVAQDMEEESEEKANDAEETKVEEGLEKNEETAMMTIVTMTDPEKATGAEDVGGDNSFLMWKKEEKWWITLLGLRISAFVLCLLAFSVLAADKETVVVKEPGYLFYHLVSYSFRWYGYDEFRYILLVNVMGFVYSGLQICDLMKFLITKKHTLNPRLRGYFNVAMDQGLAYLLMSASSSAASTVHVFRSNWIGQGALKFAEMASASIALSFLAFKAFAVASIVSGFILYRCSDQHK